MILGFTARMSSTSIFSRRRAAGRKLVRKTSAASISRCSTSRPSGLLRSIPMLRLPRLGCSTMKLTPPVLGISPEVISPRCGSPLTGCSTFSTSAPQSASTAPAAGTNHHCATSTTRTGRPVQNFLGRIVSALRPSNQSLAALLRSSTGHRCGASDSPGRLPWARPGHLARTASTIADPTVYDK